MQFSLVYSINENTNEILVPAFYIVELQMKKRGLPIFNHVSESYLNRPTPFYFPSISIVVESESSYSIIERIFEEQKVIADDIPLCALNTVIQNIEKNIESGYIQNVISLRFGYSIYNDPSIVDVKRYSGYDAECYYLCVVKGRKMLFVSNICFDVFFWNKDDPRIHKNSNCKYRDKRDYLDIVHELIKNGML